VVVAVEVVVVDVVVVIVVNSAKLKVEIITSRSLWLMLLS